MSEPTLYLHNVEDHDDPFTASLVKDLVFHGVLVPVERCEHGNVYPHTTCYVDGEHEWCPGAVIGGDDD